MAMPKALLLLFLIALNIFTSTCNQFDEAEEVVACSSANTKKACPRIFLPVCGSINQKYKDFANSCEACRGGADSYIRETCLYSCSNSNEVPDESAGNSVCAFTRTGCEEKACRKTYKQYSDACKNSKVVSFQFGECPDYDTSEVNEGDNNELDDWNIEECVFEETIFIPESNECVFEEAIFIPETNECVFEEAIFIPETNQCVFEEAIFIPSEEGTPSQESVPESSSSEEYLLVEGDDSTGSVFEGSP